MLIAYLYDVGRALAMPGAPGPGGAPRHVSPGPVEHDLAVATVIALFGILIGGILALWIVFSRQSDLAPAAMGAAVAGVFLVLAALAASGRRVAVAVVAVLTGRPGRVSLAAGAPPSAVGLVFGAIFVAELVRAWVRMGATPMRSGAAPAAS